MEYISNILLEISNENLEKTEKLIQETENYGAENKLITNCFDKFPYNKDKDIVAMKIGLIDITNSTNISRYKSKISVDKLADIITNINDIDSRIKNGDPTVVNEIAENAKRCGINLFSFASKYCCYHNSNLYKKDDYSIYDNVLKDTLPKYFKDIKVTTINQWRCNFKYEEYNNYIEKKLDEYCINIKNRKRKFDHFIWYNNRNQ